MSLINKIINKNNTQKSDFNNIYFEDYDIPMPAGISAYIDKSKPNLSSFIILFKRFFRLALNYKPVLYKALIFTIFSILFSVLSPRIIGYIVDEALKSHEALKYWITLFILNEVFRLFFIGVQSYYFIELGQRVMYELRIKLYIQFLKLPLKKIDSIPTGALVSRLTTDISFLTDLFNSGFIRIIQDSFTLFFILVGMFLLNFKLALISLCWIPVLLIFITYQSKKLFLSHQNLRTYITSYNAFLADTISGSHIVKLFQKENEFKNQGSWLITELKNKSLMLGFQKCITRPVITSLMGLGLCTTLIYGGYEAKHNIISVGIVVTFVNYLLTITYPIVNITNNLDVIFSSLASLKRVYEGLDWETETINDNSKFVNNPKIKGKIEFKDIDFSYDGKNKVLNGFNLKIEPGDKIGVVGVTGSGKTTLVNLLLRLYNINKGDLLIDDTNVNDFPLNYIRKQIGYVQQDAWFFRGTIRDNITLWDAYTEDSNKGDSSKEKSVNDKLQFIFQHEFFASIRNLDFVIENNGSNLSAGMKQVLSFARALYANPSIWILDEASANLDYKLDKSLSEAVEHFSANATVITIAHRLASIKDSTKIIVLSKGKIIEEGTHDELIRLGAVYSKMYESQEGGKSI